MTDPTPERDRLRNDERPVEDRPVMGDHPDLEPDEGVRDEPPQSDDMMARLMMPGIIVLVIVLVVIAYFLWFN